MTSGRPGVTLITGGAGFIGTNLADRLLARGTPVRLLDNLSRRGSHRNLRYLKERHGEAFEFVQGDVEDPLPVRRALRSVDCVFHLAAQVSVRCSLSQPMRDFRVNLGGTLNLLEEVRRQSKPPRILFASTAKVYGELDDLALEHVGGRYEPRDARYRRGIGEDRPLSFCSPFACSKGGADQYVRDYATSYGLRTTVFRMGCVYGPHQQGNEDQGWVTHLARCALERRPVTLCGDGGQVRDLLWVDDLVDAMLLATSGAYRCDGEVFNVGGGPARTTSLLQLLDLLGRLAPAEVDVRSGAWRVGDQRWYVTDASRFRRLTGWRPTVGVEEGVSRLLDWLAPSRRRAARAGVAARATSVPAREDRGARVAPAPGARRAPTSAPPAVWAPPEGAGSPR